MVEGCDYSFGRPDPACLAAFGIRFAVRYTSIGGSAKNMTPNEVAGLLAAGVALVTVFEETTGHMLQGRAAGVAAAKASSDLAEACGMPPGRPHYFALDVDPNPLSTAQWGAVAAYLDGAASVLGRGVVGVYGGYKAIETLVPTHVPWGWQTYAWSGDPTRWSTKAVLRQYRNGVTRCGALIDLCRALVDDYGQWGLGQEADMNQAEHDTLMWLRENATLLRDQGVRMTDHGDPVIPGRANNLAAVRSDIEVLRAILEAGPPSVVIDEAAAQAIADRLAGNQGFLAAVATAVADEQHRRSAE